MMCHKIMTLQLHTNIQNISKNQPEDSKYTTNLSASCSLKISKLKNGRTRGGLIKKTEKASVFRTLLTKRDIYNNEKGGEKSTLF